MDEEQPILRILEARLLPPPACDEVAYMRILSGVAREIFLECRYAETRVRSARAYRAAEKKRVMRNVGRDEEVIDQWIFKEPCNN
jgi:hypothetical protein